MRFESALKGRAIRDCRLWLKDERLGLRAGSRIWDLEFRVQGSGSRVQDSGFRSLG